MATGENKDLCLVCHKKDPNVACDICHRWYPQGCVLPGLKTSQIEKLNWYCNICKKNGVKSLEEVNRSAKKLNEEIDAFNKAKAERDYLRDRNAELEKLFAEDIKFSELPSRAYIDAKLSKIESLIVNKSSEKNDNSYANAVKQKNLLAIKSCKDNVKAVDKKKEVADILANFTIIDTKFPPNGNIVMNFEDKTSRDRAAQEIDGKIPDTHVKKISYLKPKILICNVHAEEEDINADDKQDIVKKLIERNNFLKAIDNVESKIEFLFMRPSAAKTHHLILKCEPEVRKIIHDHNDEIKLAFAVYHVRDRYHVRICSHCQRFGHIEKDCQHKNDDPFCGNCAERHKTRDCQSSYVKCINCVRKKKCHTNHKVGNKHCEALRDEHNEIAAKTDHGY